MDESKKMILEKRIEKTMKALEKNKMKPFYAENRQQALELVKELLQPGQTVACGGSVTLDECGILQLLRSGDYHFLDRSAPGLTPEQSKGMLKQAFLADVSQTECRKSSRVQETGNGRAECNRRYLPGYG